MIYKYKAFVTKVYDGDTITVDIELGFGIVTRKQKIRLAHINTPEVRGEERDQGIISRDVLRDMILNKNIILDTFKDKKGKYGRYIGVVYLPETATSVNDFLVENGYAEQKYY